MSDFKVGDKVWFFHTMYGRTCWHETTVIYPEHAEILQGKIVDINPKHDSVYIYLNGESTLVVMGYTFFEVHAFKSKSEAIDAMILRLEELTGEE